MGKKNKKNDKSISSYDEPIYSLDGTSWEDANWVSSLATLKDYIDVMGVTESLQKRFGLNEEQIKMLAEVKDVGNQNRSISLGRKDTKCFRDDPNITQRKLQRYFNEKMKVMFNGKGRHKRTKPSDKEKDPKPWLSHENVYRTHDMLNKQLNIVRKSMCGMGTKYVKRFLTERADNGDINAELYKLALEAEEKNIEAKHMSFMSSARDETYRQKSKLVRSLMVLCKEHDIVYGYQNDDVKGTYINTVIYFELPDMEQISFHLKMTDKEKKEIPVYDKDWDKKLASTLPKIERTLNKVYETEFIEEREIVKKEKESDAVLKEKKRKDKARKKQELNKLSKEIRNTVSGDISKINMAFIDGVIESEDNTERVRTLRTLKQYLGKFGCTGKLQERLGMTEEQIMMCSKLTDIDMTVDDYRSISIGKDDAALFDNNPDQEELQKRFDKKKEKILAKREEEARREKEFWCWDKDDWYDDRDYYYDSKPDSYYEAMEKNHALGIDLMNARNNMCGIGTRRVKLFLNRKIKAGDTVAELYRTALEIEDKNITAKQIYYMYKDKVYDQKSALLNDLIALCEDRDDVVYGYEDSDNYSANSVIYFELPGMEQISFHTNMSQSEKNNLPKYEKEWDGKVNSTLEKIENTLSEVYKDELDKEKEKLRKDNEKKAAKKQKELEKMRKIGNDE